MIKPKKVYTYSHSIEEPFWLSNDKELYLHSHMRAPSINNIEDCFLNLMKMDNSYDFRFASDFVKETK